MIKPEKKESKNLVADIRNGRIEFILMSGKDYVKDSMDATEAEPLLGKATVSDKIDGYGLYAEGKFFRTKVKSEKKEG